MSSCRLSDAVIKAKGRYYVLFCNEKKMAAQIILTLVK